MDTAVWAIVISVIALIVSGYKTVSDELDKRRKVHVKLGTVLAVSEYGSEPPLLQIQASIPRGKSVQVDSVAIAPPRGMWLAIFKPHFPIAFPRLLEEGKGFSVYVNAIEIAQMLKDAKFSGKVRLRGVVYAATGEKYLSKRFAFEVDEWLKADESAR